MKITHKLSIDLLRQEQIAQIHAVQDDSCRQIALTLLANGIPWMIPEGISAIIRYVKSDGTGGAYDTMPDGSCAWSCEDHVLTLGLAPQIFTAAGTVTLAVQLIQAEKAVSTFDIGLFVHPGIHGRIKKSEPYFNVSPKPEPTPDPEPTPEPEPPLEPTVSDIGALIMGGSISSIVLLGDSITDGAGGSGYNGSYSPMISANTAGYCWANAFKKLVEARYGIPVVNMGLYGANMLAQKDAALEHITGDDFVIWLAGPGERDNHEAFEAELPGCLKAIREKSAGLLLLSGIPATSGDEARHGADMRKMDELAAAAAEGFVPCISMYQEFCRYCHAHSIALSDCFADPVHPNDLGHHIIFRLLCAKLGLPLDAYTDYQWNSIWWNPGQQERNLADNTYDYGHSAFSSGFSAEESAVPAVFMAGFDAGTATTNLSGKHITKMIVMAYAPGTITVGAVGLRDVGQQLPVYTRSITVTAARAGLLTIRPDLDIGEHETLAFHSASDTGSLAYFAGPDTLDDPVRFWTADNFARAAAQCLVVFGVIYGYGPEPENLVLDSTADHTGTTPDSMPAVSTAVPAVLMAGYSSTAATTAVSGMHITRALLRVNTMGSITIGKVDLTALGTAPVLLDAKTFYVTETGDDVEFLLDMDIGPKETLAFQAVSDTGRLGCAAASGSLLLWPSADFAAGASSADWMLLGKLYSR